MQVQEIMRRSVVTVRVEDPLSLAIQLMAWANIRHLPVLEDDRAVGLLSEHDILKFRADSPLMDPLSECVSKAMVSPAQYVSPQVPLAEVAARMVADNIDCLPVMLMGELMGIITSVDLLREQVDATFAQTSNSELGAADVMTPKPQTVTPTDLLSHAIEKMAAGNFRHLPVVDDEGRVVGILSDRDIPPATMGNDGLFDTRVNSVMTKDVITVEGTAPMATLMSAFTHWQLSALPVVDEDERLEGIVSYIDVLNAFGKNMRSRNDL